jgi:hypothetical protein
MDNCCRDPPVAIETHNRRNIVDMTTKEDLVDH